MDQIEEVKNKIDIVELINEYLPLKKSGRNFTALCPFHSETKPSFSVSPELQIYKCFGCGKGGNVFNFVMEMEGMTFGEALRFLAQKAGVKLRSYQPSGEEKERKILLEINHLASEFYHYLLTDHKVGERARAYLEKRKIWNSSIKLFKLGYAPKMWDGLIQFLVEKKGYKPESLERAGLAIKKQRFYDRFRDRLIFPLFDHQKNVCGFSGRVIEKEEEAPKYINTPETPVYHKSKLLYGLETTKGEIKKKNTAILVEGEIDAISSYQAGVKNVAAIKGSALTAEQVKLLKRFCETIILAFDFDIAGDAAVKRGIEMAEKSGLNIRVVRPLFGKDPDECVRKSAKLWRQSVKKNIPIWDFYFNSAFEKHKGGTAEDKKNIAEELIPIIAAISNEIVKAHYIKILAEKLRVNEEIIIKEMAKVKINKKQGGQKTPIFPQSFVKKSRREILEEYLLALILQSKEPPAVKIEIETPALKKILKELSRVEKFSIKAFHDNLPDELKEIVSRLYLWDLEGVVIEDEIKNTLKELKKLVLKKELRELAAKGDLENFNLLSRELKDME